MNGTVRYGERLIRYDVVQNDKLCDKIRIHVHPDARVEVEAQSGTSTGDIRRALLKKARWIEKQLVDIEDVRRHSLAREYISGETHFYLGRRYQLKIVVDNTTEASVRLKDGHLKVIVPRIDRSSVRRRLNIWYRERAEFYFKKRIADLLPKTPWVTRSPAIRLSSMKQQWGSCSPSGSINLNPSLIRAPRECIDYVLLHELCHIREHNHSKAFYSLLDRTYPDWKQVKGRLDRMAELILAS